MRKQAGEKSKYNPIHYSSLLLISLILTLTACGKDQSLDQDSKALKSSIIVGTLDWKEIISLSVNSAIRTHAGPVGDVDLPVMGSRCTGFLISENVFMTNHHCVPTARHASGITVVFNHLSNVPKTSFKKYDCGTFIGNDSKLDFALLKCQGNPGAKYGFVTLSDDPVSKNANIYVVQQNCDYYTDSNCDYSKKYSTGQVTAVKDEYTHNADTLGGSSGSPVFSSTTNEVIAIHHAGYGNNGMGRGVENYAVPMHKIVQKIHETFPSVTLGEGDSGGSDDDSDPATNDFEPNNTLSAAAAVAAPFKKSLAISTSTDKDYFKFSFNSAGKVMVKVNFDHSDGDIDVLLINSNKKIVNKSESSSDNEALSYTTTQGGVYYVKVFGYKGAKAKYKIDVSFAPVTEVDKPNDSFKNASKVSLPMSFNESLKSSKDIDFYTFTLNKTTKFSAGLEFSHANGDLDLYLFDSDEKTVDKSTSVKNTESMSRTLGAGKYYVVVMGYKGAMGSYKLNLK